MSTSLTNLLDISDASAGQIKFPATQNPSADANTLDDYEEGTFTPTIGATGSNPTVTYGTQAGRYVKIGRLVFFSVSISTTAFSGGSGSLFFTGLPFTVDNATGATSGGSLAFINNVDHNANAGTWMLAIGANSTRVGLWDASNATPSLSNTIPVGQWRSNGAIEFSGCYAASA